MNKIIITTTDTQPLNLTYLSDIFSSEFIKVAATPSLLYMLDTVRAVT